MSKNRDMSLGVNLLYHIVRWITFIVFGVLALLSYLELFSYNTDSFFRYEGADSWNYHNAQYYLCSIKIDTILSTLVLLLTIFAYKLPKVLYIFIIFAIYLASQIMFYQYSADNPPVWILEFFNHFD